MPNRGDKVGIGSGNLLFDDRTMAGGFGMIYMFYLSAGEAGELRGGCEIGIETGS
jgi:hypothetical protein